MSKPSKPPKPKKPPPKECCEGTEEYREAVLNSLALIAANCRSTSLNLVTIQHQLDQIIARRWKATRLAVDIGSEPLSDSGGKPPLSGGGEPMPPQPPVTGTIPPNSRAVIGVVPQAADGTPTPLDGLLRVVQSVGNNAFGINQTDPLNIVVRCEPPADIDANPLTTLILDDTLDSDPTVEVSFDWQKGVVTVKATQMRVTIGSEPL